MEEETFSLLSTSQDTNQRVVLMLEAGAQREDSRHHDTAEAKATQNTETMDLRHKTHVSTSRRVAPPVQGATPRLNMAIVQFNTGDENLQGVEVSSEAGEELNYPVLKPPELLLA